MLDLPKWVKVGILITAVCAMAVIGLLVASTQSQIGAELLVVHTLDVQQSIQKFDSTVSAIDNEMKTYVLSQRGSWLSSYSVDVESAWQQIGKIRGDTLDNDSQQERLGTIQRALGRHLEWCDLVLTEAKRDGFSKALKDVVGGPADESLSLLRWTARDMVAEEARLLAERQDRARHLRQYSLAAQGLVGICFIGFSLGGVGLVRSRFRAIGEGRALLEQSRAYFESIVATIREPLLVVDRELKVRSANRAYYLKFGGSPATVEGVDLREVGDAAWNEPDLIARVRAISEVGTDVENFRIERSLPGLGRRVVHLGVKKIYRPGQQSGLVLIALEDDTERTQAEERLKQVNAELEGFAYTVAHDLRAPLRALQGFSGALVEDFGDRLGVVGQGYTTHIAGAAARMDLLIRDLLDYSRLARAEVKREAVSLDDVVSAARQQVQADLVARHAEASIEGPLGSVQAHFSTLVQVVANLLSNAVKFTPPAEVPHIRIWSEGMGARVRLWVADNGIGIAPEHHARIFKVFERLHGQDAFPGTGIGLAIVRKGIERVGGSVGIESSLGQGARFWFELPVAGQTI